MYTSRVRTFIRLAVLILLAAAPVALVGEGRVPTPESVFGFRPGADYKLATYDQSIDYFKKLAAGSKYVKLVEAGKTSQGRTMYFALISSPDNLGKIDRYREIARRLAHPQGLTDAEAQKLARDGKAFVHIDGGLHSTEVAGPQHTPQLALRPRQPRERARHQGDPRQRHRDAVADDQPGRPADGGRVVHEERRHAVRAVRPAAALPGVRRPRQQPRRLHAQHDRVARARAHLAAVGAADHLRAPPVGAVPDAHLAAAVLRAGRHRRAVHHVARSEHDRHGDRARASRSAARSAPRTWARRSTRGIRATSTTRRTSRTSRRSGPRRRSSSTRRRTTTRSTTSRRTCATCGRRASTRARGRPDGGGCATRSTTWKRRRCRCSSSRRSTRTRCSTIATRRDAIRSRAAGRRRRSPTSSRSSSAIRSPPSRCCAASRSAACACRS